jgi:hypothetical protein
MCFTFFTTALKSQTYIYDFTSGYEGWTGDFADYPITDSLFCKLAFYRTNLPLPLDVNKYALLITGNNHSDDLFMFIKHKITGLLPNTTYKLLIDVELASKYPTNRYGVGGAPGDAVIVGAGASIIEPLKIINNDYFRMNIDKIGGVHPGNDMDTVGNIGVTDTTTVYALIHRSNASHLFTVKTDAGGEVWVCIGTDSGYESTTTLYYNKIKLTFNSATTGIDDNKNNPAEFLLCQNYPNPFNPCTKIKYSVPQRGMVTIKVYDLLGKEIAKLVNEEKTAGTYECVFNASYLSSGIYYYRITIGSFAETKRMVLLK